MHDTKRHKICLRQTFDIELNSDSITLTQCSIYKAAKINLGKLLIQVICVKLQVEIMGSSNELLLDTFVG